MSYLNNLEVARGSISATYVLTMFKYVPAALNYTLDVKFGWKKRWAIIIIRKCRVLPQVTFSKFYNLYSLLSWQHDLHVNSSYYFLFSINLWSGITKSKVCHWCGYQIQQIWYHISFTIDEIFTSPHIQQINSPIHVSFIFYEWFSH